MSQKDLSPKQMAQMINELRRALSPIYDMEEAPDTIHIRAHELPDGAVCAAAHRNGELFLMIDVHKPLARRHLQEMLHAHPELMRGTEGDSDTYVLNRPNVPVPVEAVDLTLRTLRKELLAPRGG